MTISSGYDTSVTEAAVTNLTWLTDQMHAAVADLADAWYGFKYGPRPAAQTETPRTEERLESLGQLIPAIRQISEEIRSRS